MRCELILLRNEICGKMIKCDFHRICLFMNRPLAFQECQRKFFVWSECGLYNDVVEAGR